MSFAGDQTGDAQRSVQTIVDALSVTLGRSVLLDDSTLAPVAHSAQQAVDAVRSESILRRGPSPAVREALTAQSIATADDLTHTLPDRALGMERRACMPVRSSSGGLLGYIWVLDPRDDLSAVDSERIRRAAREIARLLEASQGGVGADEAEIVNALRSGELSVRRQAAARAVEQGLLSGDDVVLCLIASRTSSADPVRAAHEAVRRLSVGHAIAASTNEGGALVASVTDPVLRTLAGDEFAHWWRTTMGDGVAVGQSGRTELLGLAEAHRQASVALRVARHAPDGSAVALWPTLGANRLVAQLPSAAALDMPEPLAQMLREEPELVETLTVFLDEGGHIKASAERLSLHRSGLYYRLSRIEELSGLRLDRGDDRLLAHLAIRLTKLLPARSMEDEP